MKHYQWLVSVNIPGIIREDLSENDDMSKQYERFFMLRVMPWSEIFICTCTEYVKYEMNFDIVVRVLYMFVSRSLSTCKMLIRKCV